MHSAVSLVTNVSAIVSGAHELHDTRLGEAASPKSFSIIIGTADCSYMPDSPCARPVKVLTEHIKPGL